MTDEFANHASDAASLAGGDEAPAVAPPEPEPIPEPAAATVRPAPAIRVRDVSFRYRGADGPVLRGVSFAQEMGELVVVMGRSGAGKSTLCRCLNGLIPRFSRGEFNGQVELLGESIERREVHSLAPTIGMVFQDFESQLFATSVELEMAFGAENLGLLRSEIHQRIRDTLPLLGLQGFERREPATLSGGEKQRLAMGSVIVMNPAIYVLDEPTTDLDPMGKAAIGRLVKSLVECGRTVLLVEHETETVVHADRVLLLDDGEVVRDAPADAVLRDPDLMSSHGVRPLQMPQLFATLRLDGRPLTPSTAERELRRRKAEVDQETFLSLVQADKRRQESYGETLVQVHALTHCYAGKELALDGVNVTIRQGEFVALIGQNGCGKTTLAKQIAGLIKPTAGVIRVDGKPTSEYSLSELGQLVGYVFQNPDHQISADTVADEVAFAPRNYGLAEAEVERRVAEALAAVRLTGMESADPFVLSKGERQRVATASVLAAKPKLIILDEPTTGLDYTEQRAMMELVRKLNEDGHTILIITHSMWVVSEYAHRCLMMVDGRVEADGDTRDVLPDVQRMAAAALTPPDVVLLGNAMGCPFRSVEEAAACIRV